MLDNKQNTLILEWLDEIVKTPEDFSAEFYSQSEMENLAADTLLWIHELTQAEEKPEKVSMFATFTQNGDNNTQIVNRGTLNIDMT